MQVEILGAITRAPKGMGWKPGYPSAWQDITDWDSLQNAIKAEHELLMMDYSSQETNLLNWPEVHIPKISQLTKNKEKQELKKWLKQIAYMNHLGPYKGWLFPTSFGDELEVIVEDGHRAVHPAEYGEHIPAQIRYALFHALSDEELIKCLEQFGMMQDGKSQVYTYKVNHGRVVLPMQTMQLMYSYGKCIADALKFAPATGFTIDYMLSSEGLQPIEVHATPLGVVYDFRETGLESKTEKFVHKISACYGKIAILTTGDTLKNGFYGGEISEIKEMLESEGTKVQVLCSLDDLVGDQFIMPYKAEEILDEVNAAVTGDSAKLLGNKSMVSELLKEIAMPGIKNPGYWNISAPAFYQQGMFSKPGFFKEELQRYLEWKSDMPNAVVLKPVNHNDWHPQISYLNDINDASVAMKLAVKHGTILVEEMVQDNLILGNGETRVFYQVV